MKINDKPKLSELDFFRGLAIISVVAIHTTSLPVGGLSPFSSMYLFYWLVNEGCQFAVPAFFFLNGLVLFYNHDSFRSWMELRNFFKKRAVLILLPYSIWTTIYFLSVKLGYKQTFSIHWIVDYVEQWATGSAYYHLYFIFVLVQFYLLFPIFIYLLKHVPTIKKHLILSSIFFQITWILLNHYVFHSNGGVISFSYLLPFFLGAHTGMNYEIVTNILRRKGLAFVFFLLIIGTLYLVERWQMINGTRSIGTWTLNIDNILYYSFVCACCLTLLYVSMRIPKSKISKHVSYIGVASFAIYLAHPLFLSIFRLATKGESNIYLYHVFVVLGFFIALYSPLLSYHWNKKRSRAWFLFGK